MNGWEVGVIGMLVFFGIFLAVGIAGVVWGADSRDGKDWQQGFNGPSGRAI